MTKNPQHQQQKSQTQNQKTNKKPKINNKKKKQKPPKTQQKQNKQETKQTTRRNYSIGGHATRRGRVVQIVWEIHNYISKENQYPSCWPQAFGFKYRTSKSLRSFAGRTLSCATMEITTKGE